MPGYVISLVVLMSIYIKKNIVQSPFCMCGSVESTYHYFFECPFYRELRTSLNEDICSVTRVTLHVILYSDEDLKDVYDKFFQRTDFFLNFAHTKLIMSLVD